MNTNKHKVELAKSTLEQKENNEVAREFVLIILKPLASSNPSLRASILSDLLKVGRIGSIKSEYKPEKIEVRQHYSDSLDKPYGPPIVHYISNKMIDVLILENSSFHNKPSDFIQLMRSEIIGPSDPRKAEKDHIRYKAISHDLNFIQHTDVPEEDRIENGTQLVDNLIHCSDSIDNAMREVKIWFKDDKEVLEKYEKIYDSLLEKELLHTQQSYKDKIITQIAA